MEHSLPSNDLAWRETFVDLLLHWNRRINLISASDRFRISNRHIEESLLLGSLIPEGVIRGIDLGSGAGFPGLILAKALGLHFDLIEADRRKAAFLREAARVLSAPVTVYPIRIEAARIEPARLVTARALAPLPRLLALSAPLLDRNGACLFPKGTGYEAELTDSSAEWHMRVERFRSQTAPGAAILRITELQRGGLIA